MTPHEKAVNAINARLERLQANLREAKTETAQRFLFQSLVVTIGLAEALNDYIRAVGRHAERRHAQLKQSHEELGAQHARLLTSGKELLERLKANPTDRSLRKEIERIQQSMAAVQKSLRRGANALQRELAPSLAMIDEMATSVRRFSDADRGDALKHLLKAVIAQVRDFYAAQPAVPSKGVIDTVAWEKSALAEIDHATDFYDGYARAGYQVMLALELMTLAVSENPPQTSADASQRGNDAVATRVKAISGRFPG